LGTEKFSSRRFFFTSPRSHVNVENRVTEAVTMQRALHLGSNLFFARETEAWLLILREANAIGWELASYPDAL